MVTPFFPSDDIAHIELIQFVSNCVFEFYTVSMTQWVRKRAPKLLLANSNPGIAIYLSFTIYTRYYTIIYLFAKIKMEFWCKFVSWDPLKQSNKSTSSGFESQHKLCFLEFSFEKIAMYIFFRHQNQLCVTTILNRRGGTDSGHSWLVWLKTC